MLFPVDPVILFDHDYTVSYKKDISENVLLILIILHMAYDPVTLVYMSGQRPSSHIASSSFSREVLLPFQWSFLSSSKGLSSHPALQKLIKEHICLLFTRFI